jgi:succinate dehydrogenase / fumarate reductase membrane anchor subunit
MAATRLRSPLRSPLGRAIGLGSAKEGVEHWWAQRVTALALVPLVVWFVIAVIGLVGADRQALVQWLHNPVAAMLTILLIVATFYHAALGLQTVIEDYVARDGAKLALVIAMRFLCLVFVVRGILAVLQLALGA